MAAVKVEKVEGEKATPLTTERKSTTTSHGVQGDHDKLQTTIRLTGKASP